MKSRDDDEADHMERVARTMWRCSGCGRLNSMNLDSVCPRCFDVAFVLDKEKLK